MARVLIVGGVAGGASTAARLRRLDENAEIVLFERGGSISFANCGLPYYISGVISSREELILQTPESFNRRFRVDVRVRHEVTAIDRRTKTVTVKNLETGETCQERYDTLVLAPGAEPVRPKIPGFDLPQVFTLRSLADAFKIRDYIERHKSTSAVVVGCGFIGVEMAENLATAGLSVTLVEMLDQILAPFDYEMACGLQRHIREKGVSIELNNGVKAVTTSGNGLKVVLERGEISADCVILAIGIRPESGLAKAAGLAVNERGCIEVDSAMRTKDPAVFALGDAAEITDFVTKRKTAVALAGPANKQGRIAADVISGIASEYRGSQASAIIKVFDMTAACTGINEKTAKRLGLDYEKSYTWSPSHAGYYPGAREMLIKLIFEKQSGKILGAQITGFEGVDKRCDVLAVAIRAGMTVFDVTELELCYSPCYSSAKDPVNMAAFAAENALTGKVRLFHWNDTIPDNADAALIDVRTAEEFAAGHINGFINIPLDELRERLGEIDKAKPVYVTCRAGLRGYIAARILTQKGCDVKNLSGGYLLYASANAV